MTPHTSYLICATPRSGSFLLCETLKDTGLAGNPEEYFWRDDEPAWTARWGTETYLDYLEAALRAGSTANGVFGAKVMWGYLDDFERKLRTFPGLEHMPLPRLHYIWMTRRDRVRQAVSFSKAVQTGVWAWHGDGPTQSPVLAPVFDFEQITALASEIKEHDEQWRRFFADAGVAPLQMVYEDLVRDRERAARDVLAYLGIELPADAPVRAATHVPREQRMQRQADAQSEEWVRRYHELRIGRRDRAGLERPCA